MKELPSFTIKARNLRVAINVLIPDQNIYFVVEHEMIDNVFRFCNDILFKQRRAIWLAIKMFYGQNIFLTKGKQAPSPFAMKSCQPGLCIALHKWPFKLSVLLKQYSNLRPRELGKCGRVRNVSFIIKHSVIYAGR